MGLRLVLSVYEVRPLLEAWARGEREVVTSPDLGLSRVSVRLDEGGICYPGNVRVSWEQAEEIVAHPNMCFRVDREEVRRLQVYSPLTARVCALYPTGTAPTVTLSGVPMHRVKGTDPWRDSQVKVRAARPRGLVLDTCMGLGYTAIMAARQARGVITLELDPAVIWLARQNPWSQNLFSSPAIWPVQAHAEELVQALPASQFSVVIHDPPMFSLAGELYSLAFYRALHRALRPQGRLFHYVGRPESKMARGVTRGVMRRLQQAGFRRVSPVVQAFGVIAVKS